MRILCTAGNGVDGNWVEEAPALPRSIRQESYGYKPWQSQLILQQEVDENSDARVVMKDDAVVDTYSPRDETKVKARLLGHGFGICNRVDMED